MIENNYQEIWQYAMDQIKEELKNQGNESQFLLWYNMKYIKDTVEKIYVSVPSDFMWQKMKTKGNIKIVEDKIKNISGITKIEIVPVIEKTENLNTKNEDSEKLEKKELTQKEKNTKNNTEKETKKKSVKNETLDEKFTFDKFIPGEGSSSKFAYNVAFSVAENPGTKANPILLYGGVGLGKTHLMQAIGNHINEKFGDSKKICYIQAESFLNDYTSSIYNKNTEKFKNKYRNLDVLLLDDIHFLQNKQGIQDELFYTFEALHKKNAQMVFACDRPLKEIQNMAERLVSRLGSGMCIDLQPPNYETRKAIIYKKLEILNKNLTEEVIDYIAKTIETNIRDLESAINKVLGYAEFIDSNISLETTQELLSDLYNAPGVGNISIENIQKVVAENYEISVQNIIKGGREKKYTTPRFISIYIARELTEYSFTELGHEFGGKDHSSIMHAYNKIKNQIQVDPSLDKRIKNLIEEVKKYKNN